MASREDSRIEAGWYQGRWKDEDRSGTNWEDARVKRDHPQEVLDGMVRLRPRPLPSAPIPMELLDKQSNIGRTVDITTAEGFLDVLNLEADDKKARSVTFHTVDAQRFGINREFLQGQLLWGSGGTQAQVIFDWLRGTTLSVVASFARLQVSAPESVNLAAPIRAGAFAGYGSLGAGSRVNPQLTVRMGLIVPAGTSTTLLPAFAKDVFVGRTVFGAVTSPPPMRIHFTDIGGATLTSELYPLGVSMERPMPIPSRAANFIVENISAANMSAEAIFGLSI